MNLWAHTVGISDPDDKCQSGFHRYTEVASSSCHPSHLNFISTYLLSFSLISFLLAFQKHLLGKLLSQVLDLNSVKFFCFFLRVSGIAGTFFFFFSSSSSMVPAEKEGVGTCTCHCILSMGFHLLEPEFSAQVHGL